MLTNDSLRSLFFVLAGAGIVYAFFYQKHKTFLLPAFLRPDIYNRYVGG